MTIGGEGRWEADKSNLLSDLHEFNPVYIHIAESEPGNDFFYEYEENNNESICDYYTKYFSVASINYYGIDEFTYIFEDYKTVDDIPEDLLTILNKADIDPEDVLWYNESNETKETT